MRKILVVEDNLANMIFTVSVLENAGYEVLQADNAAMGIRLARESSPDFIFMDIQLPDMNGLDVTQQLKADPTTCHITIYALTALAMKGDEERIRAAGCDGYLSKPVSHKDLLASVEAAGMLFKAR